MQSAEIPENEAQRLAALRAYEILDTEAEAAYDGIVQLVSYVCETPIALISLVDEQRQWFKARVGLGATETPRDLAFCAHAINQQGLFVVEDTQLDERFADNPLVTSDPNIRFYAGAPLISREGYGLGTLCAIDRRPRRFSEAQQQALLTLAEQTRVQLELRRQTRMLEELTASKNRVFKLLSHDLRSPFNAVQGFAAQLADNVARFDQASIASMCRQIDNSADLAVRLVDNLLEWSRIESGEVSFNPTAVSALDALREACDLMSPAATAKHIEVTCSGDDCSVLAEPRMLNSILQNLLSNAIKFTPKAGRIELSCRADGDAALFQVQDSGVGIPADQQASVFDIEHRSRPGTEGEPGTGFGLSLCRAFVKRHGGTLQLSSQPGQGSCFSFKLPLT